MTMRQRIGRKLWVEQLERRVTPTVFSAGNEFRVNSFTSNTQNEPAVAMDADGEAIVVWTSFGQDGDQAGIYGRRYDTSGAAVGNEFQVNTYTTSNQTLPRVASDGDGDFVVVWSSFGQDGAFGGIVGQRFSAAGAKVGSEFLVNQTTGGIQTYPDVAMDSSGRFTVVWESGQNIFARRYDANGLALTDEFVVNTFTGGNQIKPAIAMKP